MSTTLYESPLEATHRRSFLTRGSIRRRARLGAALIAVAAAAIFSAAGASAANAVTPELPAATGATGWVRIAHLSPDTKGVDVQLTALSGGQVVDSLDDVVYGQVSPYMALPQGTYVVAMVPTGTTMATPIIQTSITVTNGQPMTVAAYGKNADLTTKVFPDDLTAPTNGQSRVRVVQASTTVPTVSIRTTTGLPIAADAAAGTVTNYASVPSGAWNLQLTSSTGSSTAAIDLASGSVSTLFVLDNASGGVTVSTVTDASSVGDLPTGGIQTGGGATAVHIDSSSTSLATGLGLGMIGALAAAVVTLAVVIRQKNRLAVEAE